MANPYIHGHHASVLRGHSWRTVENSCPHLLPYLDKDVALKILDVGCGPGTISIDLATRVPKGFVYAFDTSADVVEQARQLAKEKGVSNIRFEVGSIFEFGKMDGVEEKSFDIVHAHQVLQHLSNPLSAIKQMTLLAKPGSGLLALRDCDWSAMNWYPAHAGLDKWLSTYLGVAHSLHAHPSIGKALHAFALRAGFARADIDASVSAWTFSTPEERAFWCQQWAERTTKTDYKQKALASGLATEEDLEEIAKAFGEMEKCEEGWFAIINGEVICRVK